MTRSVPPDLGPDILVDLRLGGNPRYLLGANWNLMRIPDEFRKCVCFVGCRLADGSERVGGTAFWVSRFIDETKRMTFAYLVTARHVIDQIRDFGLDRVLLRINRNDENRAVWVDTNLKDWVMHPAGISVDVAVLPVKMPQVADHLTWPLESIATPEKIAEEDIGIGSEVFVSGLFAHHYGETKNIPIVRVGNIAAMPEEKVTTKNIGRIDAYLIESRSLGGLSGSPVFVRPDRVRYTAQGEFRVREASYLLGLVHGHYDEKATTKDETMMDAGATTEKINVGIAIVVPIEKVVEVTNRPEIRDPENVLLEKMRSENSPTPD
jgi:hypothetical protein